MSGPAIGNPAARRATEATLGRDLDRRVIPAPAPERLGDHSLVVPDIGVVTAVGVGGVEQPDSTVERRVNHGRPVEGLPVRSGGQPHAAESDHWSGAVMPAKISASSAWRPLLSAA